MKSPLLNWFSVKLVKIDICQSFIRLSNKMIEYLKVVIIYRYGDPLKFSNTCFCLKVCFREIHEVGI